MYRDYGNKEVKFSELKGKTIESIEGLKVGSEEVYFQCTDGTRFRMVYYDDCCASCSVEDIAGDVNDLIGAEILIAKEQSNSDENPPGVPVYEYQDSWTWTFYKLATVKGYVTIRWYGSSNGYYSESVTFEKVYKGKNE